MGELIQIHHQFKDGHTDVCSQREINSNEEMRIFIEETKVSHPLPVGAHYLAMNEKCELFVKTTVKD